MKKDLKLLGSGSFTYCYELDDKNVLIKTRDKIKTHMYLGRFPKCRLFPRVFNYRRKPKNGYHYYKMRKLQVISKIEDSLENHLNPRQLRFYMMLQNKFHLTAGIKNTIKAFQDRIPDEFAYERKMMIEAARSFEVYGKDMCITFEVCNFNLACKNGQLVLLDCFYPRSEGGLRYEREY